MELNRPIILYMHAGSGNHGCEAIADSTLRLIESLRRQSGADDNLPVVVATNSVAEDRKYILGDLEKQGLCTLCEERHIDKSFLAHVFYYAYRKLTGDKESFLRYGFKDVFKVYENKCREKKVNPYEPDYSRNKPLAISIGGDNYCYPDMVSDLILAHNVFRKKGFETILWGCSIEPESLKDERLLEDLKAYSRIYARESITYNALLKAGIEENRLKLRKDPAFELDRAESKLPKNLAAGEFVGINLSPMVLDRARNPELVKTAYRNFIKYILENTEENIALIPHVVWANNDDRKPLSLFYEEFKDTGRVVFIEDSPAEVLKSYISKCSFFVGARTHSTIAAYSSSVPTLVIGYSVKSRGIATDLFGTTENYVLPVQEIEDPESIIKAYKWIMANK